MAKNNKLINSINEIARRNRLQHVIEASERDTTQIYSAMAIALWNTLEMPDEEKADAINTVFVESQDVWTKCVEGGNDIEKLCEEITGISVKGSGSSES